MVVIAAEDFVTVLGVDIGKNDFHCVLLGEDGKIKPHSFPNSTKGFEQLAKWLDNRNVDQVHACLESTGGWSEDLACYLMDLGHVVSIVNPLAIKGFGQSELSRTKTDKADAALIARFCAAMKPERWNAPSPQQRRLQQLGRRRAALDEMRTQERNRLEAPLVNDDVRRSIERTISFLNAQIAELDAEIDSTIDGDPTLAGQRDLLRTIPGVGPRTIATLLGEVPNIEQFRSGKALAAYAGLCPSEHRSGTSVSRSSLSRVGNAAVRGVLYLPAIVAMRFNAAIGRWAERLRARGKRPKQVIIAVMRRLLVLAYGVLKSKRPFDPAYTT